MAVPFGEKRKTRSVQEQWEQRELQLQDLNYRLDRMTNRLKLVQDKIQNANNNIEFRLARIEHKKKSESDHIPSLEETAIVEEIKDIVRAYPHTHDKQPLDSKLTSLTEALAFYQTKNCQNCKNICHQKESD